MFSATFVYGLGLVLSVVGIILLIPVIRSQIINFPPNPLKKFMTDVLRPLVRGQTKQSFNAFFNSPYTMKFLLLCLTVGILLSNFVPMWFDIYRLLDVTKPSNIGYSYIINNYLARLTAAVLIYLVYKY